MQKFLKIATAITAVLIVAALLNAASDSQFFQKLFTDSRVHSLDLEKYRTSPMQR